MSKIPVYTDDCEIKCENQILTYTHTACRIDENSKCVASYFSPFHAVPVFHFPNERYVKNFEPLDEYFIMSVLFENEPTLHNSGLYSMENVCALY